MSKMTVIQLLNKIAKGEEVPKKIKVFGEEFNYDGYDYYSIHSSSPLMSYVGKDYLRAEMNYDIKIIEEPKMLPEKIKDKYCSQISKVRLAQKCNEIIDYLESIGE